ncbi:hypothetical protein TrLO_g15361 [Triparma laevis f. longispina]|uniref:EF-hand domain-containing protein n=1 Tax=Triparma laevis f. longispina TaxID=1714387 RepID=A0A9W7FDB6_9STRA|nr:hypothetical protein TrLO_g15361 [Triparma laevis f. longispina]
MSSFVSLTSGVPASAGSLSVATKWGTANSVFSGSGPSATTFTVSDDKSKGADGCTGFLIAAEGSSVTLKNCTFINPTNIGCGNFVFAGATMTFRNVSFRKGSGMPVTTALHPGARVVFDNCTFEVSTTVAFGAADTTVELSAGSCAKEFEGVTVHGSPTRIHFDPAKRAAEAEALKQVEEALAAEAMVLKQAEEFYAAKEKKAEAEAKAADAAAKVDKVAAGEKAAAKKVAANIVAMKSGSPAAVGNHGVVTSYGRGKEVYAGAGPEKTTLTVCDDKAKGSDGCTGFLVVLEGANVVLENCTFFNPTACNPGNFVFTNATMTFRNVAFKKGSGTPVAMAIQPGGKVVFDKCSFEMGTVVQFGAADTTVELTKGSSADEFKGVTVLGSPTRIGCGPPQGGRLRALLEAEDWRPAAETVGEGGVVLVRRPYRDIRIRSRLDKIDSQVDWNMYTHAFVFAGHLLGCAGGDGSRAQHGMSRLELVEDNDPTTPLPAEYLVPGLKSMTAASVPLALLPRVRVVHHIIQYQTWLVPEDEVADLEPLGFEAVTPKELSDDERRRYLFTGSGSGGGNLDSGAMLRELTKRGLQREPGMPDFVFVQRFANKILEHIKYHAGKDCANNGKPPSHAFITGFGQCGRFSSVCVSACRASGIPARMVVNGPAGNGMSTSGLFAPEIMHVCVEAYLSGAGWTLLEPQMGKIGDFTNYIALDTGTRTEEQLADARTLHPGLGGQVQGVVDYYFNKHDLNKDGVLAKDEFKELLADMLGISVGGNEIEVCQVDEAMSILDLDGDGNLSRAELQLALEQESLLACGRAYSVGQSTCSGTLLKFDGEKKGALLPGDSAQEARLAVQPAAKKRYIVAEKCLYTPENNPFSPETLGKCSSPVVSLEFDRVEVRRLKWNGDLMALEDEWGSGPSVEVAPLFNWPDEVGGYVDGKALRVPREEAQRLFQ